MAEGSRRRGGSEGEGKGSRENLENWKEGKSATRMKYVSKRKKEDPPYIYKNLSYFYWAGICFCQ